MILVASSRLGHWDFECIRLSIIVLIWLESQAMIYGPGGVAGASVLHIMFLIVTQATPSYDRRPAGPARAPPRPLEIEFKNHRRRARRRATPLRLTSPQSQR
jgi:hypothetical protein